MSTYFVTANYTSSAMKGMMENPHNRKEAINGLLEKMDITLDCFYVSATGHIFMVITGNNVNVGAMALNESGPPEASRTLLQWKFSQQKST